MSARKFGPWGFLAAGVLAVSLAASSAPAAPLRPKLAHAEDFSTASALDESFWQVETGFFRNKEAQYYQPANVFIRGGLLLLEGRREPADNAAFDPKSTDWLTATKSADYTSGSIVSREPFTYGIVEVVARLPQAKGTWPAIWTIWEHGGVYREIDMVEAVGNDPGKVWSTVFAGYNLDSLSKWQVETPLPDVDKAFHTYRLEWRPDAILISIDGRQVQKVDPEAAHKDGLDPLRARMHLRINLALGGSWGGAIEDTALPARIEVKSIKVWHFEP